MYSFTASSSGEVVIRLSNMRSDMAVELYVYDDLDYTVASVPYCENEGCATITDATSGTHYTIEVRQTTGEGAYSMIIE